MKLREPCMTNCHITIENADIAFEASTEEIILDSALNLGISLPYQCRGASCGTCKAKILEGSVDHGWALGFAITDEEKEAGFCLMCQARPTSAALALRTVNPVPAQAGAPATSEFEGTVVGIYNETPRVKRVIVRVPDHVRFTYPGGAYAEVRTGLFPQPRMYSFASAASAQRLLDFYVALHPDGKASGYIHRELRLGHPIHIKGPFGYCRLPEGAGPVLCLAGGTGIAPILAILEEQLKGGLADSVHLLFSVREAQEVFALDRLSGLRAQFPHFTFDLTLTDAPGPLGKYADTVPVLLPRIYKTLREHRLIISGSPGFVDACMASAIALEASPENISFDRFDPVSPR